MQTFLSFSSDSLRVGVRGMPSDPGGGAQLPGPVSPAVLGVVRGRSARGLHHRLWLEQGQAGAGEICHGTIRNSNGSKGTPTFNDYFVLFKDL